MPEYIVMSPLHHDGKFFGQGDGVAMEAQAAKPLLAKGVIVVPKAAAKTEATAKAEAKGK
jgi:hypothetical protein